MTKKEIKEASQAKSTVRYTCSVPGKEGVYEGRIDRCLFDKLWFIGRKDKKVIFVCISPLSLEQNMCNGPWI